MKLKKFLEREAERAGVTVEHLLEHHDVIPCDCGTKGCKGWQVRYMFGNERRRKASAAKL
jgi:hypothetical protein